MKLQIITRFVALGILVAGLLVLTTSIGFLLYKSSDESGKSINLPEQVAGLRVTKTTFGTQALLEIARLHGKEFPLITGAVGRYGDKDQVIIWIAEAADKAAAEGILLAMRDRIADGKSPFTPTGELQNGKRIIYSLTGLDQHHFYFQSGNQIVWVAAEVTLLQNAFQQVLVSYP
jgi:hypothetical protein